MVSKRRLRSVLDLHLLQLLPGSRGQAEVQANHLQLAERTFEVRQLNSVSIAGKSYESWHILPLDQRSDLAASP